MPLRILVVEDSRTQAESLRYILEMDGHEVTLATNGRLALESIAAARPDMVLSDIIMPVMDGYELLRRIKEDVSTRSIPVILVTQLFDPVDVIKGLESGADNFIIKPYEPSDISSRIGLTLQADQPGTRDLSGGTRILLADGAHTISSGRAQILNILLSTYEIAVRKNNELMEAQERIGLVNEKLQHAVSDLEHSNIRLKEENGERIRIEKALAEVNKKLHLMTNITRHDLLNQLSAMRGYLELAELAWDTEPVRARENMRSAGNVINRTTNTISFAAEYQKIGMKSPVWKDIRTLVEMSIRYVHTGPVRLENDVPSKIEIFADPLIEKVFPNLIDNAVRYGNSLTRISFSCKKQDRNWIIICEDDGVGILPEEKEKIFSYKYGKNTGLGLFLSREILAITGISIRETGTPGTGARFELLCPEGTVRVIGQHQ